jgi:molybdopterin molybdotransferase
MTPSSLDHQLPVAQAQIEIAHLVSQLLSNQSSERVVEQVETAALLGRILAADVMSPINVPPHDNSAMDGYAVRFVDLHPNASTTLTVTNSVFAGQSSQLSATAGEAIKVMTGAMMPIGADTVIPFEGATLNDNQVVIPAGQVLGQNRRFMGEDLVLGTAALKTGRCCTPADMGLIASLGIQSCAVYPRLKVAIFSTGNEVAALGQPLLPGQVYDSNRFTLLGMLARLNVEVLDLGVVPDDPLALEAALKAATNDKNNANIVISSGGVSVGEADFTRTVMAKLGKIDFCTVAMRPGRPIAVGTLEGDALYFGLPGNPVAVMITFYFFVKAAIRQLAGETWNEPPLLQAKTVSALRKKPGRTEYQRAFVFTASDGRTPLVRSTGQQGSGVLRSMSEANCLVVLNHQQANANEGDWVDIVRFDGLI